MNDKFVLIGGGENGRPGHPYETFEIDNEVCSLARPTKKLLFVGLSQVTSGEDHVIKYYNSIKNLYGDKFGCEVSNFDCYNFHNNLEETKNQILNSDIIYFGGGDTNYLATTLKKFGLDKAIITACHNGTVLAGLSAGCNLMGMQGLTLVQYKNQGNLNPVAVDGLNLVPFVIVPHYSKDKIRQTQLKEYLSKNKYLVGLGIDDGCALVCNNGKCKSVSSIKGATLHICKFLNNIYTHKTITIDDFVDIDFLYNL